MSEHVIPPLAVDHAGELAMRYLRLPSDVRVDGETVTWVYDPDLTSTEAARLEAILALASSFARMDPDQYAAVRGQMQTLRDLRQMGRSAFMALTAAERDRLTYDAFTAVTQVLLSVLRD